jgi:hypothetical protein
MIGLITPSGGRREQINICEKLMKRQTYQGDVVWVIVDDCIPQTIDTISNDFRKNWTIIKIYPIPSWQNGQNTQARNIVEGIQTLIDKYPESEIEAIFIIEDDDYYRPVYLERMMANFGSYDLIGEINTIYYNVVYRRHITNLNNIHASLFQTAFKYNVIDILNKCFSDTFIDCILWYKVTNKYLFYENDLAIGIKGLPGRYGIGGGHENSTYMTPDTNLSYLINLIGKQDAELYARYYNTHKSWKR